jgi:magnesium-transporting ATPase (P-type)
MTNNNESAARKIRRHHSVIKPVGRTDNWYNRITMKRVFSSRIAFIFVTGFVYCIAIMIAVLIAGPDQQCGSLGNPYDCGYWSRVAIFVSFILYLALFMWPITVTLACIVFLRFIVSLIRRKKREPLVGNLFFYSFVIIYALITTLVVCNVIVSAPGPLSL